MILPAGEGLQQLVTLLPFLGLRVPEYDLGLPHGGAGLVGNLTGTVVDASGLLGLSQGAKDIFNLPAPLAKGGEKGTLIPIQPFRLNIADVAIVFLSQNQEVVLIVQFTQMLAHPGPCVVTVPGQGPQVGLPPGYPILQPLKLVLSLPQLACQPGTALLRLFQLVTLGGQIIVPHSRPLGLGLLQAGARLPSPLRLFLQPPFQIAAEVLRIPQLLAQTLRGLPGIQIGLALAAQNVLVIPVIFGPDDSGALHGRLVAVERVLQIVHLLHGADHGGQIVVRQHLEGQIQELLYLCWTEILGQLGHPHHNQ